MLFRKKEKTEVELSVPEMRVAMLKNYHRQLEKLGWTVQNIKSLSFFSSVVIRVQGNHKVTGGTTACLYKPEINTVEDVVWFLNEIFYSESDTPELKEYIVRAKGKVPNAYAVKISIDGYDGDGDSLDFDFEFSSILDLEFLIHEGFFVGSPNHPNILNIGGSQK